MATDDETESPSPDQAFAVLGDETRMAILRALGEVDGPVAFSELRDRAGVRDSGQFNYHLDKLLGTFATKSDGGYELRQAGRRVIEAVLSGAITEDPVMEPTAIDEPCPLCGGRTAIAFRQECVEHYCTECAGYYGVPGSEYESTDTDEYGYLGAFQLPPAGVTGRTPEETFRTASTWGILELMAVASDVCPRCSAPVSTTVHVCEDHEVADGHCEECGNRHAVHVGFECTNCLFQRRGACVVALVADLDLLRFLVDHDINPVSPTSGTEHNAAIMDYDEDVRSVDPFEAQFTFSVDGDALSMTVDDDLTVVETTRE